MAYDINAIKIENTGDKFTLDITLPNGKVQVAQFVNLESLNSYHKAFFLSVKRKKRSM